MCVATEVVWNEFRTSWKDGVNKESFEETMLLCLWSKLNGWRKLSICVDIEDDWGDWSGDNKGEDNWESNCVSL